MDDCERQARFGLTREELIAEFDSARPGDSLSEEFMDGELWPTAGLSDRQIELLAGKLNRVVERDEKLGRTGLLGL